MEISLEKAQLISELEEKIANNAYNKYNNYGRGGWYRYPINYKDVHDGKEYKWDTRAVYVNSDVVESMRYDFGENQLYIGYALEEVLDYLETRYHLDFTELEKKESAKFHTDEDDNNRTVSHRSPAINSSARIVDISSKECNHGT